MGKIDIENYKGFGIKFDTDTDRFSCLVAPGDVRTGRTIDSIRKVISGYARANSGFEPFWVETAPEKQHLGYKRLRITGIRSDGVFLAEDESGEIGALHSRHGFILYDESNSDARNELAEVEAEYKAKLSELKERRKTAIAKFKAVTLHEYAESLNEK